jgi:hypothetical protein
MVTVSSKNERIVTGFDIANESRIGHGELNFSFPCFHRRSFGMVVSGMPYLTIGSIASADLIDPIIGVDFLPGQIGCCMNSSLDGSKFHGLDKIG